jgi:hypothetical protein
LHNTMYHMLYGMGIHMVYSIVYLYTI